MLYVNLQTSSCHYHSVPDESAYTVQCHVCTCHGLNNNIRYSISKINVHYYTCNNNYNNNSCSTALLHTQDHRAQGPVP